MERDNFTPTPPACPAGRFPRVLWWLGTAEERILMHSITDRNKYQLIGISVLCTWAFATLAWTYFFFSFSGGYLKSIFLGLFMGFIILNIDRLLIKGITNSNKRKFWPIFFRGLLALAIGTFMAQPALMYMFDKEIALQTSLDNEQRRMANKTAIDALYASRIASINTSLSAAKKELHQKSQAVEDARKNYLAETDGSGGTGKIGIRDIALAKKQEYLKLDAELASLTASLSPTIDAEEYELKKLQEKIQNEQFAFDKYLNNGFLTRVEALNNLVSKNAALQARYFLVLAILLLIELMPVIAKTLLPAGSYEEKLALQESLEIFNARQHFEYEKRLSEIIERASFENNADAVEKFFQASREKMSEKISQSARSAMNDEDDSADHHWEQMKKKAFVGQHE